MQTLLSEISPALTLESLYLRRASVVLYDILVQYCAAISNAHDMAKVISVKKFNKEQQNAFNSIFGEFLRGVTADNLEAPVQRPFNHYSLGTRAYFLHALWRYGKNIRHTRYTISAYGTQA